MEDTIESFSLGMRRVPTCIAILGHDTDENILKSKMLLWANTGRGDFSHLNNVLINDNNVQEGVTLEQHVEGLKKKLEKKFYWKLIVQG